jgi:hypothetical protein
MVSTIPPPFLAYARKLWGPNLDEPRMTHSFFSAGYGAFIAFFVPNEDSGLKIL